MQRDHERESIIVGVDTHKEAHVAVAIDNLGQRLGEHKFTADGVGYTALTQWADRWGGVGSYGVEGTGCYGAGLARHLRRAGHRVIEIDRPDRRSRRRGKSDSIDAEAAARSVLAGVATTEPKTADDSAEMLRALKIAKDSAVRARTQAGNQLKSLVVTAHDDLRHSLRTLTTISLVRRCSQMRPGELRDVASATKHAMRSLARRYLELHEEITELFEHIDTITIHAAPQLRAAFGVGPDTAAGLIIAVGDNANRLTSERAFAAMCGTNPIPASSGNTTRHRLNRGGNRQANAALYRIVLVRLQWDQPTKDYVQRRTAEGKTKPEIIRCLKRYVAREIYPLLLLPPRPTSLDKT